MSIRAVCVDRGRLIIKEPSVVRVEGSSTFVPVPGPWFRCRLFLNMAPVQRDPQLVRESAVPAPQVLVGVNDECGDSLMFRYDYELEIRSPELGCAIWRMSAEPQPLRKRHRVIGWLLTVDRVIERDYDDLLLENPPSFDALAGGS